MQDITRHYLISGRVQGVGYRRFAAHLAYELDLKGWVRNLHDGRVEAVARGPEAFLKDFEQRLRKGPPHGRVDSLSVEDWAHADETDFEVRKDGSQPCVK